METFRITLMVQDEKRSYRVSVSRSRSMDMMVKAAISKAALEFHRQTKLRLRDGHVVRVMHWVNGRWNELTQAKFISPGTKVRLMNYRLTRIEVGSWKRNGDGTAVLVDSHGNEHGRFRSNDYLIKG